MEEDDVGEYREGGLLLLGSYDCGVQQGYLEAVISWFAEKIVEHILYSMRIQCEEALYEQPRIAFKLPDRGIYLMRSRPLASHKRRELCAAF